MPIHDVTLPTGHTISDDRARLDLDFIHGAMAQTYWAKNRSREITERSIAHCLCFGIYTGGRQVGFARLLTDYAMRGHLGDVFIAPEERGAGLGKALLGTILSHPALGSVTHWTLTTQDAHGLYARFGFKPEAQPGWMTLRREADGRPEASSPPGR